MTLCCTEMKKCLGYIQTGTEMDKMNVSQRDELYSSLNQIKSDTYSGIFSCI